MAEFWEPWQPKTGDRVRVRLSGECDVEWPLGLFRGHKRFEDGRIGTVVECSEDHACHLPPPDCHRYAVRVDQSFEWDGTVWHGGHYAAIELEPDAAYRGERRELVSMSG